MEVREYKGQPAGKEEDSKTSDENGPLLVPDSAQVVSGQRHHTARMLVDYVMCRDGKPEGSLPERRVVRSFAARIIKPLLDNSSKLYSSARFLWSNTSKLTAPWPRVPTIPLSRKFSITLVLSVFLQ